MAMIDDCLAAAVKAGTLSEQGSAEYRQRMKDAEALAAERGMAGASAYSFAVTEAAKAMEKRATSTRAQVQQTILAIDRAWADASSHGNGLFRGLETVFGQNIRGGGTGASIEGRRMALLATMQSQLSDFLEGVRSTRFGLQQNTILPRHTVSALYGRDVADKAAKDAAAAWTKSIDWWVARMREAGVPVGKLEDWRLPQHFDALAVKALDEAGFVERMEGWWRDGKLALRDWSQDGEAMLRPGVDDDKVRDILSGAYRNITTNGAASMEPGAVRSSTMADRYGRRRAFEWTSDEAWLEFNRELGVGDDAIGELMVRHLDSMARDLALAQTLGPDPDAAARVLMQMARKAGLSDRRLGNLQDIYFHSSGKAATPVSNALALAGQGIRSALVSAQLGGAVLSAPTDFAFTQATAAWNGLDMTRIMSRYVEGLNPANKADRLTAMRRGLILENGLRGLHDASRDAISDTMSRKGTGASLETGLSGAARIAGRAAEVVMRAQGLAHHTQILRDAVGMEFQGHWFDLAGKSMAELSGLDRRTLKRYGITADEWDLLRTGAKDARGFIDPTRLATDGTAAEREAALKMLGAIAIEQRIAVPEANVVTRAFWMGQTQPGTVTGEFMRAALQYKGFAMSAGLMHGWRMVESLMNREGQMFRGQYIAALVIQATVMGAVALQLKNIAGGRDPEPMFSDKNPLFWAKAAAQGGAGGIIGDQVKAMFSTKSTGDAARLLSPTGALGIDLAAFLGGNVSQALAGERSNTGREAVNLLRKYLPEVFYTRLATDRLVWDTLQKAVDPDAAGVFARMQERARKEQGTAYYWRPGSTEPRAPDMGNAVR